MSFLERVIGQKQIEIASKKAVVPLAALEERAQGRPARNFFEAVSGSERVIAEIKRRSPLVDAFEQSDAIDELPRIYESNGAAALSVVTDTRNFGTSLEDARRFRRQTTLPVLVKDFVIDPYQLYEARGFDADAVLLISRILDLDGIASLLDHTSRLGMEALVEVHSSEDIRKALAAGARIVGINHRDLEALEVDTTLAERLVNEVPGDVVVVAESGISSRAAIESLSSLGVGAFLIGGALLDSPDPGARLREMLGVSSTARYAKGTRHV